jgi:hypothetical protein
LRRGSGRLGHDRWRRLDHRLRRRRRCCRYRNITFAYGDFELADFNLEKVKCRPFEYVDNTPYLPNVFLIQRAQIIAHVRKLPVRTAAATA